MFFRYKASSGLVFVVALVLSGTACKTVDSDLAADEGLSKEQANQVVTGRVLTEKQLDVLLDEIKLAKELASGTYEYKEGNSGDFLADIFAGPNPSQNAFYGDERVKDLLLAMPEDKSAVLENLNARFAVLIGKQALIESLNASFKSFEVTRSEVEAYIAAKENGGDSKQIARDLLEVKGNMDAVQRTFMNSLESNAEKLKRRAEFHDFEYGDKTSSIRQLPLAMVNLLSAEVNEALAAPVESPTTGARQHSNRSWDSDFIARDLVGREGGGFRAPPGYVSQYVSPVPVGQGSILNQTSTNAEGGITFTVNAEALKEMAVESVEIKIGYAVTSYKTQQFLERERQSAR